MSGLKETAKLKNFLKFYKVSSLNSLNDPMKAR